MHKITQENYFFKKIAINLNFDKLTYAYIILAREAFIIDNSIRMVKCIKSQRERFDRTEC
jgi:hypothetical protein